MSKIFRYYQDEADKLIYEELLSNSKCIVKMFCGTGKSLLMRKCKSVENQKLVVYVFPSLSLIDQFYSDYLNDFLEQDVLRISSECESTTEPIRIKQFLSKSSNKIICITYQSFKTLLDNLGELKINVCVFDEAHHAVGETYQKLIFENNLCEKQIFFTATPKNANGIIMYDRENVESGMCGKLVYDYSFLRGVNEEYLNPFEIQIDMFSENNNKSIFESLARSILSSGNSRVLTFHSSVSVELGDTSVMNFVNEKHFKKVFEEVRKREFPANEKYKKISMIALTASITTRQRKLYLDNFDSSQDNEIYIISSCETIGEGIDTKNANMCVFVDPKSSYVKIIQNIGRIVRKQFGVDKRNSTILIPCWVDKTKYLDCQGDKDKCDEVIREDMSADGNFNGILNVLSALKQEDEDLYDICLHYPDTYSPQEIKSNLKKQGFTIGDIVGEGSLQETIEHLLEIDEEDYDDYSEEEMIMKIGEDNDVCIEIHTNSLENPIEKYNGQLKGDSIRLYKSLDEETEEHLYQPIIQKETRRKRHSGSVNAPKRENRLGVKVHTNPDIKVLWNITSDLDLTKDICSCAIDCEVVDNWFERLEELKQFIDSNKKRPQKSTDKVERQIYGWLSNNCHKYKYKIKGMKDATKYSLWTDFLEKYKDYFKTDDEIWYDTFNKLKEFIDTHKTRPSSKSNDKMEKQLGSWIRPQKQKYINKTQCMKDDKVKYNLWTEFVEEYKEYLLTREEIWYDTFQKLKLFLDSNRKRPIENTKHKLESQLSKWLSQTNIKYNKKISPMKDETKYNLWTEFVEEYKEYLLTKEEIWYDTFKKLKLFIDANKKRPSQSSKNKIEKHLSIWISHQRGSYNEKQHCMRDETKYNLWTQFIDEYKDYILTKEEIWYKRFEELKKFIKQNKRRPIKESKNDPEKMVGHWLQNQINNYRSKRDGMKDETKYNLWTNFLEEYKEYFKSDDEIWYDTFEKLKLFMNTNKRRPLQKSTDKIEKQLGVWITTQQGNYCIKRYAMKDETKYNLWSGFVEEYKDLLNLRSQKPIVENTQSEETESTIEEEKPKKVKSMKLPKQSKTSKETSEKRRERTKSEISELHREYKTLKSENLHNKFQENPDLWTAYHEISEENEKSFPEEEIPRNRVIQQLDKTKTKRTKRIVDLGCGKGQISQYYKDDKRFQFYNYDHISADETITSCDISNIPLEEDSVEMCILSLAMWGSNCREYIQEANRILETGGRLYIIEPTKRWSEKDELGNIVSGKEGSKLKSLLEENSFQLLEQSVDKFCMFVCIKI